MQNDNGSSHPQELFLLAYEASPTPTAIEIISDTDEIIADVNPAMEELLGFERSDFVGKTTLSLGFWPDSQERNNFLSHLKANKRVANFQTQVRNKAGDLLDILLSAELISKNNTTYAVVYAQNITALLRIEENLQYSQKMEECGHMAAGIAHDFNSVLSVIQMLTNPDMLSDDIPERFRKSLNLIHSSSTRAIGYTRQLLAFSREKEFKPKKVHVEAVISDFLPMLQLLTGEDNEIKWTHPPRLPKIHADPRGLEQVVMNLVINARDAMSDGGNIAIDLSIVDVEQAKPIDETPVNPGRYYLLKVADSGEGIDDKAIQHILEPFFSTKEDNKGTGLGLAVVNTIVKQHNGWIEIDTTPGKGSEFKIYLPPKPQTEQTKL